MRFLWSCNFSNWTLKALVEEQRLVLSAGKCQEGLELSLLQNQSLRSLVQSFRMLQYYSYSLPSTLRGTASHRGVKRKYDSLRCGYAPSFESPKGSQFVTTPPGSNHCDHKKQQIEFDSERNTFSTPVNHHGDAGACFGLERVQSMDLDLSITRKSSSFTTCPSSSFPLSQSPYSSSISSAFEFDSLESRGGKQQLGIRMFFNSSTSSPSNGKGEDRKLDAVSNGGNINLPETCLFCITPHRHFVSRMTSVSCTFCSRSSCSDCITDCENCNFAFCKFCDF